MKVCPYSTFAKFYFMKSCYKSYYLVMKNINIGFKDLGSDKTLLALTIDFPLVGWKVNALTVNEN